MSELTTVEVAERLGKPLGTVKRWVDRLDDRVPVRIDGRGARKFDERALVVLEQIKRNLEEGRSLESVRLLLPPLELPNAETKPRTQAPQAESEPAAASPRTDLALERPQPQALDVQQFVAALRGEVVAAVSEQTELAEKYARAAHSIGKLEAQLDAARAEGLRLAVRAGELEKQTHGTSEMAARIAELEARQALAQAATAERERLLEELERQAEERERSIQERARLETELERARTDLSRARIVASAGPTRAWWKVWG